MVAVHLTPSSVSELTAEQVQRILVKPLEARSTFLSAGPRIFDTDGSPIRLPRISSGTTPGWHAPSDAITDDSAPNFGELTLMPSPIKSVKILVRFSNELARQSVLSLETVLRDRLVTDVAAALDTQFLSNNDGKESGGTRLRPAGIINVAGQSVTGDNPGPLTHDLVAEAMGKLTAINADPASFALFITPAMASQLRREKDADARFMGQWDPNGSAALAPFGIRTYVSGHLGANTGALVDMSRIAVARDLSPSVKVLTETFGDYDEQALRVVARYDMVPMDTNAIVKIAGVTDGSAPADHSDDGNS